MTPVPVLPRDALALALNGDQRLVRAFEQQAQAVSEVQNAAAQQVDATEALADATFLTLSANATLTGERVLRIGSGLRGNVQSDKFDLDVSDEVAHVQGGFPVYLVAAGPTNLVLPLSGTLVTRTGTDTLANKTLVAPKIMGTSDYADDAAAAAAGVPVDGLYRTGSVLKVRMA